MILSLKTGEKAESNGVLLPIRLLSTQARGHYTGCYAVSCGARAWVPGRIRCVCMTICLVLLGVCGVWKNSRTAAHCYSGGLPAGFPASSIPHRVPVPFYPPDCLLQTRPRDWNMTAGTTLCERSHALSGTGLRCHYNPLRVEEVTF